MDPSSSYRVVMSPEGLPESICAVCGAVVSEVLGCIDCLSEQEPDPADLAD